MDRRNFLITGAALPLAAGLPRLASAQQMSFDPRPGPWRTFEITTRAEILKPAGNARVDSPAVGRFPFQKPLGDAGPATPRRARRGHDGKYRAKMLAAQWQDGEPLPVVEVTSRFTTRNRATNLGMQQAGAPARRRHHALLYRGDRTRRPTAW